MWHCHVSSFYGMLKLNMAALLSNLDAAVSVEGADYGAAVYWGAYHYTQGPSSLGRTQSLPRSLNEVIPTTINHDLNTS
jgi:hypothetical protein